MKHVFLYFFFASILMGLVYIHRGFVRIVCSKTANRYALTGFMVSFVGAIFLSFALKLNGVTGWMADGIAWYAYLGIGYLSFVLFLLILRDVVAFLVRLARPWVCRFSEEDDGRTARQEQRRFLLKQGGAYAVAGTALVLSGTGFRNANATPKVLDVTLPVRNLPPSLSGFSMVQISDIHLGPTLKRDFLESVVGEVNRLKPDMVALTGDLVDGFVAELGPETEPLRDLSAPFGLFFVTGNHEYYFNAPAWVRHVESLGMTVLNNSHRLIEKDGGRILMAGVTDLMAGRFVSSHASDPFKAMENAPDSDVKILLAHQPKSVYQAEKAGFDIQLSGHTHGGQMFPWNLLIALNQPFLAGLYTHGNTRLYVSRGTGYWGPPMRIGAPSEITRLILVPEQAPE